MCKPWFLNLGVAGLLASKLMIHSLILIRILVFPVKVAQEEVF